MATNRTKNLRLNGINPLSYIGVNPYTPPGFYIQDRDPTNDDNKNVLIGDLWLNTRANNPPLISDLWMLVALGPNGATWRQFTGGGGGLLDTLTGNTGGAIMPDGANNINVVGNNAVGLTIAGNPVTNTLTVTTTSGNSLIDSITGNVGGAVPADALQNINLLGDVLSGLVVSGNPGTNTLTITTASTNPSLETLTGDVGGTVPADAAHNINIVGGPNVTVTGNPGTNTLQIDVGSASLVDSLTGNTGGAVGPDGGGNINIVGDQAVGLTIDGNPGTNTLTVTSANGLNLLETLTGDSGGPVPADASFNINIVGGTNVTVAGNPVTNTLTINATGAAAGVNTLTGDSGGTVGPDGLGNIDILGTANVITVTGNPGANSLTINTGDTIATTYVTDAGNAVPAGGVLNVLGAGGVTTAGAGNTISINGGGGGGSGNQFSFFAYYPVTSNHGFANQGTTFFPPITSIVQNGYLGSDAGIMTELFDNGGNFFPGDDTVGGTPATFTAPVTGYYYMQAAVSLNLIRPSGPTNPQNYWFTLVTPSYTWPSFIAGVNLNPTQYPEILIWPIIPMTAGETARIYINTTLNPVSGESDHNIYAVFGTSLSNPLVPVPPVVSLNPQLASYWYGWLIST